ncbi:MAG: glycosyltransferase [Methanophagales archaeon]|nr:glycosyltransferase [Methanophagales archaeon]
MTERGHEVTVYTTDGFKSRLNVEKNKPVDADGIKTYYFRNLSSYLAREMVLPIPCYLPIVARREIRGFDVIHIHEHRTVLGTVVHHYAKKYNIPYILQAHGSVLPTFQRQRLKNVFDLFFGYRILKDATKVLALTKTEAEHYKDMDVIEDKIEIVPNGIDLSEYENLPKKGEFRREYLIRDDEKIILYLGRLHKSKGIDLLVKAFSDILISKEVKGVRLVLIGPDDGYRSALDELVHDLKVNNKVLFTGFVTNNEKMVAFVDADVFVTPSFYGFPVTFLEACACGMPIITTNKGDELDWIHDKVGYMVEYDKDPLRNAIIKVLSDEGLRGRFGEEGKKLVREEFGWDKIVKYVEQVYISLISYNKELGVTDR